MGGGGWGVWVKKGGKTRCSAGTDISDLRTFFTLDKNGGGGEPDIKEKQKLNKREGAQILENCRRE